MALKKTEPRGKAFWPILGLLLALSAGALSWVFTPEVLKYLDRTLPNFPTITPTITWVVTGILFIIIALVFSLVVAFAVPKRKGEVNEVKLAKERSDMVRGKAARKVRQRDINRQNKAR